MGISDLDRARAAVAGAARPLSGSSRDHDGPIAAIGDARVVLLGEASHGTREFSEERARITRRLIEEAGFAAVCVEGGWSSAYRVNRFVRGADGADDARSCLDDFRNFPRWLWRNEVVRWLSGHNDRHPAGSARAAGFHRIDPDSLHASIRAVVAYLETVDAEAARRARDRYACFDHFAEDPQAYGHAANFRLGRSCEDEVVRQLADLRGRSAELGRGNRLAADEFSCAEQDARRAINAERYCRAMLDRRVSSRNLRDTHMAETLDALIGHLGRQVDSPRVVVWARNSHLGDARASASASRRTPGPSRPPTTGMSRPAG